MLVTPVDLTHINTLHCSHVNPCRISIMFRQGAARYQKRVQSAASYQRDSTPKPPKPRIAVPFAKPTQINKFFIIVLTATANVFVLNV